MKIAVPTTKDKMVDSHFGHCEFFTVFTIDENRKISDTQIIEAPSECGCKSGIASILSQNGVTVMLAGNMGPGAVTVLNNNGITVYRGCAGNANEVALSFAAGSVSDSGETCSNHGGSGHQCENH
jgi:predicted Fe-Mo cluster-binding NifX family protein